MSTFPSTRSVAVSPDPNAGVPTTVHVFEDGSYTSAVSGNPVGVLPPTTKTLPSGNGTAACPDRAFTMLAAGAHAP
jgi:hypothetical protein